MFIEKTATDFEISSERSEVPGISFRSDMMSV